jgi:lipoprotein-anchoring transpeptidase ErfK/SrfK
LFIHGNGSQSDWTWGCVALDDKDIRELFDAVPIGTPVTIEH